MSWIRNSILAASCLLIVLMIPGSISAAAFPKQQQTGISAYLMSAGPNVTAQVGLPTGRGAINRTSTHPSKLRFDPLLLKLAREGRVQNIRLMGDGTVSLLAESSAVRELQARGSTVTQVAPMNAPDKTLSGVISGVVSASTGGNIRGATVSAFLGATVLTTTTASNGSYSLSLPTNGDYQVGVSATGYEWQPAVLVKVPSTANDVNFSLVPDNLTIQGRVTNQANNAMPGIQVYATDSVYDNFTAGDYSTTDASGNYTLTVSAATYEVRAFAPPYGAKSRTITVPVSATGKNFSFDASGVVYTVSGLARTSSGAPLPGTEIAFYANNIPFSNCDPQYANLAVAGSDGRYSVTLPTGAYQTYTNWPNEWADHWVVASTDVVTVTANNNVLDRTLPAVGTIRGIVRDPNGAPLANARVFSWRANPTNTWFDGFFTTDANGAYVVTATLGTHYVLAFHDNYALSSTQTVALVGNVTGVDLQVTAGIAASGTLTGSDGRSLRWADVTFQTGPSNGRFNKHAVVYYNGTWRSTFAAGSYYVAVSQPFYNDQGATVNIAPNPAPINFTLVRKTQRIVGRVSYAVGGSIGFVCDAYLTASDVSTDSSSYGNSAGDGYYAMMVAPGTYDVWPYKYGSNSPDFTNQIAVPPVPASLDYFLTQILTH